MAARVTRVSRAPGAMASGLDIKRYPVDSGFVSHPSCQNRPSIAWLRLLQGKVGKIILFDKFLEGANNLALHVQTNESGQNSQ